MAGRTSIEWANSTWNPWRGCTKISPGCKNCYMYRDQILFGNKSPNKVIRSDEYVFTSPLRWKKTGRVFTCSWSDFFIQEADEWRSEAWEIISRTPKLTYLLLTKRPENISSRLPDNWKNGWDNVWLGVSAENQHYFDIRVSHLLTLPAKVRFVSCEPLLETVTIGNKNKIDWVIVGGESGPNCRKMESQWVKKLRDECLTYKIPFFFKQWGGVNRKAKGRLLDNRTWDEIPGISTSK
ncbi:MAG: phage Gp37/Gp68 family protein [Anaerolineaceae bacterium]|nr:phage Gp37/Gp68 family protein [Anaerolineaceae bacterium]